MTAVTEQERQALLALAWQSIRQTLQQGRLPGIHLEDLPVALREPGACFVTLTKHGQLRGCIGSLQAHRPLALDVLHNASAAAFRDPRFPPVVTDELKQLSLHISVLGPSEALLADNEAELLAQLRPGIDGLTLDDGAHRATFLPSVWEQLPEAAQFLRQLKRKAGLADEYWSDSLRFERYQCEYLGDP